jgi:pimeloyl-ACP methyl ester carboxylesterase
MRRSTILSQLGIVAGSVVMTVTLVAGPGAAQTRPKYPVPYNFAANIAAAVLEPGTPPPGSNDWSCRPSAAHPDPVVLVHGLFANMTDNWQTMSPLLANNGYCVFALSYGNNADSPAPLDQVGGLTTMEQSAAALSGFVNRVLTATGARKVDIVGHSEGATMPDYYIEYLGGAAKVARYVGVSGVKHGTTLHGVGTFAAAFESLFPQFADAVGGPCGSCPEFLVGSDYTKSIEARAPARGVVYTNISTRYDELVSPYTSSFLAGPNVTNITLQDHCTLDFSDHLSIISSPITGQYILNALDPTHAKPPPCTLVLPAA